MMPASSTRTRWLPFGIGPGHGVRLLCLPHAGAGASAYRAWGRGLPSWILACPVQPPGRENRINEAAHRDIRAFVDDLADDLVPHLDRPYAVFGHSVGALTAFELTRELRRRSCRPAAHLFLAGSPAPHLNSGYAEAQEMSPARLGHFLRTLGGTPKELLDDPRYLELFAPLFQADLSVKESYRWAPEPPLTVPITAFGATDDPRASWAEVRAWQEHTVAGFAHQVLDGGHFAVLEKPGRVYATIAAALQVIA